MIGSMLKHYKVEDVLGKGGMGVVYRAMDTRLNRPVALKLLSERYVTNQDLKQRFVREARAASAINHPAIAQVYDVDEVDGQTFIAMELVEGDTVRELIEARELDLLGALEISIQVADGLAKAHESGIVHRDIKAENLMITRDGRAKILDFGLAKLLGPDPGEAGQDPAEMETVVNPTVIGAVMGTVSYMSPEQARGRTVDHRSDLFSMGIVLYEMVTGELPFHGDTPLDTMHAIAYEETRPVTTIRMNLPASLQRVVGRCLRKKPEDRYDDTRQLVQDLKAVQKEVESGISTSVPLAQRLQEQWSAIKEMTPGEKSWPVIAAIAVVVVVWLLFAGGNISAPGLFVFALFGLIVYRRIRNRSLRLGKQFTARVKKLPEARVVVLRGREVTVLVDRAVAKTYVRINAWMDRINRKMFFGEPFTVSIRDDFTPEQEKELLNGPGVLYMREEDEPED
jgi:predicted Ser/Thr protein kinase